MRVAEVSSGVRNVTRGMGNYTTSIKGFADGVEQAKTLDLTFDWRTGVAISGHQAGIELRDDRGNLVFALAGTGTHFRYGVTGPASESTCAPESLHPVWTEVGFDRAKWYTVNLHLDFTLRRVQYLIASRETAMTVIASGTASIAGKNLAKLVTCNYFGTGVQSIDNFRLTKPVNPVNGRLKNKTVYAFGDSIVQGHSYQRGFVNLAAERELLTLTKYARNGATVGPAGTTGGQIVTQVRSAAAIAPDQVVFNGGTNDAEHLFTKRYELGTVARGFDPAAFDNSTYAGSLETTLSAMRAKWPNTRIIYVAVHKLGSRDWETQLAIREATLRICGKWGVKVADIFNGTSLDTRIDSHRAAFTFDGLVNGYPGTGGTGTHPNLAGISAFYLPTLIAALLQP
ncbi:SGNH/GDSL hydrolase family protein [Kribbella deserti]|uniref:SGNH/GDSL hydrolase family protein n=1 Tax=Kribbella deserti TaxID=1926257 RepID=A0ABV6QNT4_9ACTN